MFQFTGIFLTSFSVLSLCLGAVFPQFPCAFPTCDLPPPHCRIVHDPFGCPTCNFVCEYGPFVCQELLCQNYCQDGYSMDQNGCQTCSCKIPWHPPHLDCHRRMQCPLGACQNSCHCQPNCTSSRTGNKRKSEGEEGYEA